VQLDGVIATDPVALAGLLRATGPVSLPLGASLTADNAVSLLLSDAYRDVPDPKLQDAFFAAAAKAVFEAVAGGQGDAKATVRSLADAAAQGRLSVWSARVSEEQQLAGTSLAGRLPAKDPKGRPSIGVFLNDGTAAKLDYYLRETVTVSNKDCAAASALFQVRVELTSAVPDPGAKALPAYVVGSGLRGLAAGSMRTQVYVYAPSGGAIDTATIDGKPAPLGAGVESDRAVGVVTVDLAPGQTRVLDVVVNAGALSQLAAERNVAPIVRLTPLATPALLHSVESNCRAR
jgi:hypothetical protein